MPEGLSIISRYFPELSDAQLDRFESLAALYEYWNGRINVISRKDLPFLYEHHVLHALAIAKFIEFIPGSRIMDIGTGGGIPGLPLAIMFPEVRFDLVDSIGKKIRVVRELVSELKLTNVSIFNERAERMPDKYDFVTGRAVTALEKVWGWVSKKIHTAHKHSVKNGLIYLKGGDFQSEISMIKTPFYIQEISDYFEGNFYLTKKIVHIPKTR